MAESIAFPWLKHLPEDAQREFFDELGEALDKTRTYSMPGVEIDPQAYVDAVDVLIVSWKATAEVHSDPELYKVLTQDGGFDEGDFEEVSRPESCPSNVPHEQHSDGARWCSLSLRHGGPHMDRDGYVWNDRDAEERRFARMPLPCGWCFMENGEEVHPHPECPESGSREDAQDAFDEVLGADGVTPENAVKALKDLYGGDWEGHIVARASGPDYVKPVIPGQREEGPDCG